MASFTCEKSGLGCRMWGHLQLAKVPLCLLIGLSTLFGTLLARPTVTAVSSALVIGVVVLAMGGATLNSLQERHIDSQMERTRNRPLPKGTVPPQFAACQAILFLLFGMLVIAFVSSTIFPPLVACFAVILYNGIYTPLKKRSLLAILPGALCGALPPYIGWLAADGAVLAYTPVLILSLFILWQVPHFWLVMLSFQRDYLHSDQPSLIKQLQEESISRFFITWIGSLVFVMYLFIVLPLNINVFFKGAVIINGLSLLAVFIYWQGVSPERNYRILFVVLNNCLLFHMVIISVGRLVA